MLKAEGIKSIRTGWVSLTGGSLRCISRLSGSNTGAVRVMGFSLAHSLISDGPRKKGDQRVS
jgi:hypothetical protein